MGRYLVRSLSNIPMDVDPGFTTVSLTLVFISFLTTNIIYSIMANYKKAKIKNSYKKNELHIYNTIATLSSIGVYFCTACALLVSIITYFALLKYGYTSLYLGLNLGLPNLIIASANLLPYFIALYLATLPRKNNVNIVMAMYLVTLTPLLIAGRRLPFILALLFWLSYVLLRKYTSPKKENWLGRAEKIVLILLVPMLIIGVPFIADKRAGDYRGGNPVNRTLDSQGVTLDVISQGLSFENDTPKSVYGSYTFAPLLDYLTTNFLSRKLFNTKLIAPQTKESAVKGKSYADTISFLALPEESYYSGQGLGSSYIVETYIDFGIIGIVLYSAFLGLLINWMNSNFAKSLIKTFLALLLALELYALPRSTSLDFLVYLFQIQFLVLFGFIYVYAVFVNSSRINNYAS